VSGYVAGKIAARRVWAPGLVSLTIDAPIEPFAAGQFVNLGLELGGRLVRRSYSLASAPLAQPEFYLTALETGELSPALLGLDVGAELLVDPKPQGFFTLNWVPEAAEFFYVVGCTPPDKDAATAAPNHSPRFYVDEDCLKVGVKTLSALALDWLASNKK
jgi:ferredoxin-NADP reductase